MDIIVAAALIAVGIVGAAAVYARVTRGAWPVVHAGTLGGPAVSQAIADTDDRLPAPPARANGGGKGHSEELVRREQELTELEAQLTERTSLLDHQHEELLRELERISGVSATRAKQLLIEKIEDDAKQEAARRLRQIEDDTRREADRRVRNILSVVMQRLAAGHAAETTVSVVQLAADDMKGRIIGREGRNIRVLETLTGVDFIIDDTPGAVVLSGFDGVRREIARLTLEKLLQDGRIHPARIEEIYYQAKSELESHIVEAGEAGRLRSRRAGTASRVDQVPGTSQVPHELRAERARALGRGRAAGGDDGRQSSARAQRPPAGPRCCTTSARRSRTRSRARTHSSAANLPASTARPRPSPTRCRPTTTRSSRRRWRR